MCGVRAFRNHEGVSIQQTCLVRNTTVLLTGGTGRILRCSWNCPGNFRDEDASSNLLSPFSYKRYDIFVPDGSTLARNSKISVLGSAAAATMISLQPLFEGNLKWFPSIISICSERSSFASTFLDSSALSDSCSSPMPLRPC